jgi:transposase-like protein
MARTERPVGGRGRDRRREARWRRIIREHGRSGLGVREFCRRGKLTETAFYFWRRELQRREGERHEAEHLSGVASAKPEEQRRQPTHRAWRRQTTAAPTFVAVQVAKDIAIAGGGRIEIELSGGRRVHVTAPVDRQALADVLAVLEGAPC